MKLPASSTIYGRTKKLKSQYIDSYSIGDYTHDENDNFERVYSTTISFGNTSGVVVCFIK